MIKIERPGAGDFARHYDAAAAGQSSYFVWLNRGKESVELDIKGPDGQAVLAALLARADVIVAVSEALQERIARMGRTSHLLTHGVDLDCWRSPAPAAAPISISD